MNYYNFEHFWSPEEVCAQKSASESQVKITREIKKFFSELLGRDLGERSTVAQYHNLEEANASNLVNSEEI